MKLLHRNLTFPATLCAALLAGCSVGTGRSAPPPFPVTELLVTLPEQGPAPLVLQFRERNALVIDLRDVPGEGGLVLQRREGRHWPARLAFRLSARRFETLEVRGLQRVVFPVSSAGATAVVVELPPGVYDETIAELSVRWGIRGAL